jgi:MutS domain V
MLAAQAPAVLIGAAAVGLLLLLGPRLFARARGSVQIFRRLRDLRASRHTDMAVIAAYHERLPTDARAGALDDRTWTDLDLDDVFQSLDYATSEPGRQYLYHLLRTPRAATAPLVDMEAAVRRFASDDAIAGRARDALAQLSDERAAYLVELFLGDLPKRPRFWWLFPLLTASALTCLALIAVWPRAVMLWLAICFANVVVQVAYKPRVKKFIPALHELPAFLRVAASLGQLPLDELGEERRTLSDGATALAGLGRATWWLRFEPGQSNEIAASAYEYVNLLFLIDVNAFVFATETLRQSRTTTRSMFEAIGYIDAVQSVATWRATLPAWTQPAFLEASKAIHVEGVVHPLVANAVPNSIEIENTSVLITGSNMSGKTTFVRAMGVSAVLVQSLHTACARVWRAPLLHVRTSIGRADNVMEGKSYYLAEVESVLALIRAKESGAQHLFLLDEIFRGTNTTERIAAAYAVLAHLNRGLDLVVVATHDLEVLGLLGGAYTPHHFREQITDSVLTFDYLLQPGPSSTRNAIALLEYMKYPKSVVADALGALDWQRGR